MQKKLVKTVTSPGAKRSGPASLARQVRIIGGQWKRTPLPVLDVEGLRPTPDRVRETVFNWLNHLLDNDWQRVTCLDLFAGTGALGFEAASRGALQVVMVESNSAAVRQLQATQEKLRAAQVNIVRGDASAILAGILGRATSSHGEAERFQLIFLDPPYHQNWLPRMLPECERLLSDSGIIYIESEFEISNVALPEWLAGWETIRADKAGMVFYHLLQRKAFT